MPGVPYWVFELVSVDLSTASFIFRADVLIITGHQYTEGMTGTVSCPNVYNVVNFYTNYTDMWAIANHYFRCNGRLLMPAIICLMRFER